MTYNQSSLDKYFEYIWTINSCWNFTIRKISFTRIMSGQRSSKLYNNPEVSQVYLVRDNEDSPAVAAGESSIVVSS